MDDSDESFSESDQSDLEAEYDSEEGEEGEEGGEENDRNDEQVLQPWFRIFPPEEERRQPDFQETVGPQNMPNRNSKPIAYFYLLMTLNFLQHIVQETNRYLFKSYSRNDIYKYIKYKILDKITYGINKITIPIYGISILVSQHILHKKDLNLDRELGIYQRDSNPSKEQKQLGEC